MNEIKAKNIVDSNFSAGKNHFFDYTPDMDDRKAVRIIVINFSYGIGEVGLVASGSRGKKTKTKTV